MAISSRDAIAFLWDNPYFMDAQFLESLTIFAVRLVIAAIVLLIGRFLAGRARAFVKEILARPQIDAALSETMEGLLVRLAFYGTMLAALIIALAVIGVPAAAILSVTSAVLVVVAIALRESLANFAATIMFMIYQPFTRGEEIETLGRRGVVQEIQLFNTVIMQPDRSLAILPNGQILQDGLINYTRLGISRVDMPFTLKYEADMDQARKIILDFMTADSRVLKEPPPAVWIMNLGENGMEVQARPFVKYADYDPVQFGFRQQIVEKLNAAGIEFAVPQRDVTLDGSADAPPATE